MFVDIGVRVYASLHIWVYVFDHVYRLLCMSVCKQTTKSNNCVHSSYPPCTVIIPAYMCKYVDVLALIHHVQL
jgi:hypothetical protein